MANSVAFNTLDPRNETCYLLIVTYNQINQENRQEVPSKFKRY